MAINFPSSPVHDQTFLDANSGAQYVYNSTFAVWNKVGGATITNATLTGQSQTITTDGVANTFAITTPVTNSQNIIVTLNGLVQVPNTHYWANTTYINFYEVPIANKTIEIRSMQAIGATGYTGSAGTTSITGFFVGQNFATTGTLRRYLTTNSTINKIAAWVTQSTGAITFTIRKNGSAVATLTIPNGSTYAANSTYIPMIADSDYITIDLTTGSGADIGVRLDYTTP